MTKSHILIIYAHPNHDSFNGAILKTIRENISSDHQVKLLDLYAENFDPVLRFDKEKKRREEIWIKIQKQLVTVRISLGLIN